MEGVGESSPPPCNISGSGNLAKSKFLVRSRNLRGAFADSLVIQDLEAIVMDKEKEVVKEEKEGEEIVSRKKESAEEDVKEEEEGVMVVAEKEEFTKEEVKQEEEGEKVVAAKEEDEWAAKERKEDKEEDERNGLGSKRADDDSIRSLESETDSSKASTSDSDQTQAGSKSPPQWHGFFKLLKKRSAKVNFQTIPALGVQKLRRQKTSKRSRDFVVQDSNPDLDGGFYQFKSSWKNFTLSELQSATNNFSHDNLIGEGGYSEVYKGQLEDGMLVAIKRLTGGTPEEMTADFLSELGIIVHVDHPNIAKLIGYGVEGGMHLVLQLSPHGSLASLIRGSKEKLDWSVRYKIALGTADGLLYLHEGCQRRIIHKDIKAANILLTEDFEPQISDFGLAKWLPEQWTHHVISKFEGTFGYLPPEFFMHGIVDEKTDIFAYGVLLLELITGRLALDDSQSSLVMWAKPLLAKNSIDELVDPCIADSYDSDEMNRAVLTASLCVHQSSSCRPQAQQALQILRGDKGSLELVKQLEEQDLPRTCYEELLKEDEYNPTECLNDLNEHKLNDLIEHKIALEL